MELNIINQTSDDSFEEYRFNYETIMSKTLETVKHDKDVAVSVIFVDDKEIHQINKEYRNIDRPTDVISFALQDSEDDFVMEGPKELGDIFISIDTMNAQAKEYGHSVEREANFLFTHGLLHLLGYDHMEKEEEKVMFALQDEILGERKWKSF